MVISALNFVRGCVTSPGLSELVSSSIQWRGCSEIYRVPPALKPLILHNLSDRELQPTMRKQCSITNLPKGWLPRWSSKVVHEGPALQDPEGEEINNPLSKADLHQGYHCSHPAQVSKSSDTWEACCRQRSCDQAWEQPCGEL